MDSGGLRKAAPPAVLPDMGNVSSCLQMSRTTQYLESNYKSSKPYCKKKIKKICLETGNKKRV